MRVILEDDIYEMGRKQFRGVLGIAKKAVGKNSIYAIEKNGIAEMRKNRYKSVEELKKAVAELKNKGFNVYFK